MRGLPRGSIHHWSTFVRRRRGALLFGVALLGGAGVGGLAAGYTARFPAGGSSTAPVRVAEMAPADVVNMRFPADWIEAAAEAAPPRLLAFASADDSVALFSPKPIYPVTQAHIDPPAAAEAAPAAAAKPALALASAAAKPAPKPVRRTPTVLSESQIAGIKKRLNLTPDQERYWPAVAAELRKLEYKKDKADSGSRMAAVDTSKVNVEGLKSAGYPLVMSFDDDQRRELKSLAHLLGLESVMSGI
jgi:hypothetical protein